MQQEAKLGKGRVANELRIWGISCQDPIPPRTTLSVSGEINQLDGAGWLPQYSNGGPLGGLGSSIYKQDLSLNRALRWVSEGIGVALNP